LTSELDYHTKASSPKKKITMKFKAMVLYGIATAHTTLANSWQASLMVLESITGQIVDIGSRDITSKTRGTESEGTTTVKRSLTLDAGSVVN